MFELEIEITRWKQEIVGNGVVSSEESSELESHLRESVASLSAKGLTAEEAFIVGANRLGHPQALQEEYGKNNFAACWEQRFFWMLAGYLGVLAITGLATTIGTTVAAAMAYGGFGGLTTDATMSLVIALTWIAVIAVAFRARQRFGSKSEPLPVSWMVVTGMLLFLEPAINMAVRFAAYRSVSSVWHGEAPIYLVLCGSPLNLLFMTLCFVALWKLNDRSAWNLGSAPSSACGQAG